MAIAHSGFTFISTHIHGAVLPADAGREVPLETSKWFGVAGESHIIGEAYGTAFYCDITLDGFGSWSDLNTWIDNIFAKQGKLTGTLTVTGPNAKTISNVTFIGFQHEQPFLDGSLVNGWVCRGRLLWRQRQV